MAKKAKKLAGIDRRGEDTWRIRYVKDGKRRTETIMGTQEDAVARRDVIRVEIAQNTWTAPTSMTLSEWAVTWTEQYLRRAVSTRSYDRQKSIINRHIVPALGKVPLQKLSAVRINELYRQLETGGLHPATIHYVHVVLGSCLKAAFKVAAIARNPVTNASPPKASAQSGGHALTQPELDKLLTDFCRDPLFTIVALAAGTGARVNELLALEWSAVDWDTKALRIDAALKPTSAGLERGTPKTERSRRTIRLDDGLAALLKAERERQEAVQRMLRGMGGSVATLRSLLPEHALIFPASPIDPTKPRRHGPISKAFAARAAKLGFGGLRFHDLRHTHATLLLQAGVPVAAVSARLGHANAAVTLGIYSHSTTDAEAAAAQVAGSLLSNVLKGM
ncbi:MAG: site-specific integrase [Alphaproteobacteria bacterium]|nr:site-specific integrase [Alphaproteobacteria bacterium]